MASAAISNEVGLIRRFIRVFTEIWNVVSLFGLEVRRCCNLREVVWDVTPSPNFNPIDNNTVSYEKSWAWASPLAVSACGFQKLGRFDASNLFNGSWVVVAEDSQARPVALSLLSLVLDSGPLETVKKDLFKRHSGCQIVVGEIGMQLDFIWVERSRKASAVTLEKRKRKEQSRK